MRQMTTLRRWLGLTLLALTVSACGSAGPYSQLTAEEKTKADLKGAQISLKRGLPMDAIGELARAVKHDGGPVAVRRFLAENPDFKAQALKGADVASTSLDGYWLSRRLAELWAVSDAALPELQPIALKFDDAAIEAIRSGRVRPETIPNRAAIHGLRDPGAWHEATVMALLVSRDPNPWLAKEVAGNAAANPAHPASRVLAKLFDSRHWALEELEAMSALRSDAVAASIAKARAPVGPEDQAFGDRALRKVERLLKDPNSVQYRDVILSRSRNGAAVCGELNAKNSYGGYIGFARFFSFKDSTEIFRGNAKDNFESVWRELCVYQAGTITIAR